MKKNLTINMKHLVFFGLIVSLAGFFSSCSKKTYSAFQAEPAKGQELTVAGSPYSPFIDKIPENQGPVIIEQDRNETIGRLTQKLPLGKRLLAKALLKKSGIDEKTTLGNVVSKLKSSVKMPLLADNAKQHRDFSLDGSLRSGVMLIIISLVFWLLAVLFAPIYPLSIVFWVLSVIFLVVGLIEILLWLLNQA